LYLARVRPQRQRPGAGAPRGRRPWAAVGGTDVIQRLTGNGAGVLEPGRAVRLWLAV